MNKFRGFFVLSISTLLILSTHVSVFANKVKPMNLESLAKSAERVFVGECIEIKTGRDPESKLLATWYTFQIMDGIKGEFGETYVLKQYGGSDGELTVNSPSVTYKKGEQLVIFLYGESKLGFSSAVGIQQGKFSIKEIARSGTKYVTNGMPALILFENMENTIIPINSNGIKATASERLKSGRIELQEFLKEIKRIISLQQAKKE
jgi:hypothetical protein